MSAYVLYVHIYIRIRRFSLCALVCVCACACTCVCVCTYMYAHITFVYPIAIFKVCAILFRQGYNADLCEQLREARVKIHALQQHLEVIRGHTIGFILEQMNTLHIKTKESQL